MKNIFPGKLCKKYGGKTSPRIFFKKSTLSMSVDEQSEVSHGLFLLHS